MAQSFITRPLRARAQAESRRAAPAHGRPTIQPERVHAGAPAYAGFVSRILQRLAAGALVVCLSSAVVACSTSPAAAPTEAAPASHDASSAPGPTESVTPPPSPGRFSYQLGGAYPPAPGVTVVSRDRTAGPAAGLYSICYVNGYQAQPGEVSWWRSRHPELLLRDGQGELVIDAAWGEPLLDIGSAAKRQALLEVVGGWIDGCASAGFQAVEPDNLDSYTRSRGLLTVEDAVAFASALARRAHAAHLAIAQKNAADLSDRMRRAGYDFAVAEECQVYSECATYVHAYGREVVDIEYADQPVTSFAAACRALGDRIALTRRDRDLVAAGAPGHIEQWCPPA